MVSSFAVSPRKQASITKVYVVLALIFDDVVLSFPQCVDAWLGWTMLLPS